MKAFLRSDGVQAVLGWLLGSYLRLVLATVRWRHENVEAGDHASLVRKRGLYARLAKSQHLEAEPAA